MGKFPDEVQFQRDPALDDWFAEAGELDWQRPDGRTVRRVRGEPEPVAYDLDLPLSPAVRRRRAIAIGVVVLLVAAASAAFLALRGGNSPPAPTTTATTTSTATTTPTTTTTASRPVIAASALTVTLPAAGKIRTGDTESQVKRLQRALTALGFAPGPLDGIYGPLTDAAVVRFQQTNKLATDGVVGPITTRKLNALLATRKTAG